jgi:hypothetical protein
MGIRPELYAVEIDTGMDLLVAATTFESTLKLLIQLQEASVSEGHENEFQLDEIS